MKKRGQKIILTEIVNKVGSYCEKFNDKNNKVPIKILTTTESEHIVKMSYQGKQRKEKDQY